MFGCNVLQVLGWSGESLEVDVVGVNIIGVDAGVDDPDGAWGEVVFLFLEKFE